MPTFPFPFPSPLSLSLSRTPCIMPTFLQYPNKTIRCVFLRRLDFQDPRIKDYSKCKYTFLFVNSIFDAVSTISLPYQYPLPPFRFVSVSFVFLSVEILPLFLISRRVVYNN